MCAFKDKIDHLRDLHDIVFNTLSYRPLVNQRDFVLRLEDHRILVIDDDGDSASLTAWLLQKNGFTEVSTSTDAREAIARYMEGAPDLVIVDLHMPGFSGVDVVRTIRELDPDGEYVPIVVMTGDMGPSAKREAFEAGCNDFIDKFAEEYEFLLRVRNCLRTRFLHVGMKNQNALLEQQVYDRTRDLVSAQEEVVQRLAAAAEYRDDMTGRHVERVGNLAAEIARAIGFSVEEAGMIQRTAKLHDIGKIGISDTILHKRGPLTPEERRVMQTHTTIGDQILANGNTEIIRTAQKIARSHHERWDGNGYPDGLSGEAIPLPGRIVAVADVFDALITERPYKDAILMDVAREIILDERGRHFDPEMVDAFRGISQRRLLALTRMDDAQIA
ncbi:MAG TPA: HD domain-containing phosphohydrolase [Fimbriimonadaceae bacterium]|nr:HD domain-containing phosphohydrolase [Fimbriimonadaceae bacterium]